MKEKSKMGENAIIIICWIVLLVSFLFLIIFLESRVLGLINMEEDRDYSEGYKDCLNKMMEDSSEITYLYNSKGEFMKIKNFNSEAWGFDSVQDFASRYNLSYGVTKNFATTCPEGEFTEKLNNNMTLVICR